MLLHALRVPTNASPSPPTVCSLLHPDIPRAILAHRERGRSSKRTTPSRTPPVRITSWSWAKARHPLHNRRVSIFILTGTGTYVLREDLHLATPPPHPSEAPIHNPNPLATTLSPPSAGTKLSLVVLAPRQPSYSRLYKLETTNSTRSQVPPSIQESPHETNSQTSDTGSHSANGVAPSPLGGLQAPAFGEGNPSLLVVNGKDAKDPLKRRKPKSNIVKSNSSFVSRVIPHEGLSKRLQERNPNGLLVFANVNRALQWLDFSSSNKVYFKPQGSSVLHLT